MIYEDHNYKKITIGDSNFGIENKNYMIYEENAKMIQR